MRPPAASDRASGGGPRPPGGAILATAALLALLGGCAHVGRLENVGRTVTTTMADSTEPPRETRGPTPAHLRPLFGDTLIGLRPETADSTIRFLGRLRDGYTADTLNIILCGDNRPGYRLARLMPQVTTIKAGLSLNPIKILRALVTIPYAIGKGLYPDLALILEAPAVITGKPKWSREHQVMQAMMVKIDTLKARGENVAAVINSGDLVYDGQYPAHWERFLRITDPLTSRVPYFPVVGNHERTDTALGVENWRIATGLPIGGDRLYYCFDSADGWVRFIALDTNPIVDVKGRWTREVQVKYSDEQFTWLVARVKEHTGPVMVLMHHPPFSSSYHRLEWQRDAVLSERRERMVRALHDAGISIIVSGHDHGYQRALLTWPDGVLVAIVSGGAGSPLHPIPASAVAGRIFSEYKVAGSIVKPENVSTAEVFNYSHVRLWFGGGDLQTYAVDRNANATLIDKVQIDLGRYGTPKIDQHKVPIPPSSGPAETPKPVVVLPAAPSTPGVAAKGDSATASERLLSKPKPNAKRKPKAASASRTDTVLVKPPPAGSNR